MTTGEGALPAGWRDRTWDRLGEPWDVVVVGGGITGAGILRLAASLGWRALLVERADFASGTSSRSSKMVHGGLRYLAQGQVGVTRTAVVERERLLRVAPGLVEPLGFLMPTHRGDHPGRLVYEAGLTAYDLLAGRRTHRRLGASEMALLAPHVATVGLQGGFRYQDAQTDDARLTLRVIIEAVEDGACALSHAAAEELLLGGNCGPRVRGVRIRDVLAPERTAEIHARVVVNATGAWADGLRSQVGAPGRIRPLRGSHLTFPAWRLPVAQAVSFLHPADRRPIFAFPWEGVTLAGTTDVDHEESLDAAATGGTAISAAEVDYLLDGLRAGFPSLGLGVDDVLTTFSGVRPVIGTGQADPSKESRDHVVWDESGLVTVTGGKLTTFARIARDTLEVAASRLAGADGDGSELTVPRDWTPLGPAPATADLVRDVPAASGLDESELRRLAGRLGASAPRALASAVDAGELERVPGTPTRWVEMRWAARAEGACRLEDLLLRRTRLGVLLADGGESLLDRVRGVVQAELGWDDGRWERERADYLASWRRQHATPGRAVP